MSRQAKSHEHGGAEQPGRSRMRSARWLGGATSRQAKSNRRIGVEQNGRLRSIGSPSPAMGELMRSALWFGGDT